MNNIQSENKSIEEIQRQIILQQSKMIKDLLSRCEDYAGDRGLYESLVNRKPVKIMLFCYKILEKLHLTKPLKVIYSFFSFIKKA